MTGEAVPLMMDLIERGIIRVLDVMFITKDADGTFAGFDATDLTPDGVGDFAAFEGASSGLLGDDDLAAAAAEIEPGTSAVMIVYENRWAGPFVAAVHRNGGRLIGSAPVGVQDPLAAPAGPRGGGRKGGPAQSRDCSRGGPRPPGGRDGDPGP